MHMCRGNNRSAWHAEGGYEPIAEKAFSQLNVDRFLLEYDTDRAGGFEPLRFMPQDKMVVLGLISSKEPALEPIDELRRRIDEAQRSIVPLENLAIAPQCGFASHDARQPADLGRTAAQARARRRDGAPGLGVVATKELFCRDPRPFCARREFGPGNFRMANALAKAAVGSRDDIFLAHDARVANQPLGHQLRVLDQVGRVPDDTRDERLAVGQFDVLPDRPVVFVARVGCLDRDRIRP